MEFTTKKTIYLNNGEKIDYVKLKGKKGNLKCITKDGNEQMLIYDEIHFIIKNKNVFVPTEAYNIKFLKSGPLTMNLKDVSNDGSCTNGMVDAIDKTDFKGARIGGAVTGFFFPIGFVGTAIIASATPDDSKLNPPDKTSVDDKEYVECYRKTAKKQRRRETWTGSMTGVTVALLISSTIMALSF